MHARDATGRQVSLLNDEPVVQPMPQRLSYRTANQVISQPFHPASRSNSSSPHTPELLRSDSYDSNASSDPLSPLTPTSYDSVRATGFPSGQHMFDEYDQIPSKRPAYANNSRANSYEEDSSATSPMPERPGKRYPCRYRDSHGCEKTFTTSGHASRHSKIHTAEKAVQCTFHGCQKKFTRADNMKQHLETHYKDKSRSSASAKAAARSSLGALSTSGRRSSSASSRTAISSRAPRDQPMWDAETYGGYPPGQAPLPSPVTAKGTWDLRGLNLPLLSRPSAVRTPSSGLDALAMAVACQEGA
ncbi:C2H2 transcription factor [Colletotrichum truncatum]|uniref:C2H2 transcription factor n=1 Tax=Colletotrichum truncatum TaxID=5467 RepID=A0ACC3YXK0_COLTU|nr:C2H2 transcription factor [Colletotrichum truncatum]KAF6792418.1 C2H2 transcription factor [Colletotrichum truncatum]